MNYCIILAGGIGSRMASNNNLPKQFWKINKKPIIVYTLEKFVKCKQIDKIIIACNSKYITHMNNILEMYKLPKITNVIKGGINRQDSIKKGIDFLSSLNISDNDIVLIHDAVRPLIDESTINMNIEKVKAGKSVLTARKAEESVAISRNNILDFKSFMKRDDTYYITSPQTFKFKILKEIYKDLNHLESPIPLLDSALLYTFLGNNIEIVLEKNKNIKLTTMEDYYILKALLTYKNRKQKPKNITN